MASAWEEVLSGAPSSKRQVPVSGSGSDREDKVFRLLMCTAKLGLKTAADLRMVSAIVYRTAKAKADLPIIEVTQAAQKAHNEKTKGVSGHKEGAPDVIALMTCLLEIRKAIPKIPRFRLLMSSLPHTLQRAKI